MYLLLTFEPTDIHNDILSIHMLLKVYRHLTNAYKLKHNIWSCMVFKSICNLMSLYVKYIWHSLLSNALKYSIESLNRKRFIW